MLLNPSADRHREQIKSGIAERSPLAGLLGLGVLAAFASNYHSVGVGSYTSIQGQTVSVGLLGMGHSALAPQDKLRHDGLNQ